VNILALFAFFGFYPTVTPACLYCVFVSIIVAVFCLRGTNFRVRCEPCMTVGGNRVIFVGGVMSCINLTIIWSFSFNSVWLFFILCIDAIFLDFYLWAFSTRAIILVSRFARSRRTLALVARLRYGRISTRSNGEICAKLRRFYGRTRCNVWFRKISFIFLLLALCGDVHPNPGPGPRGCHQMKDASVFFLSVNINSIYGAAKRVGLDALLQAHNIPDVVMLQETKLSEEVLDSELPFGRYKVLRLDRRLRGGGVLIAVKKELIVRHLPRLTVAPAEILFCEITGLARGHRIVVGTYYRPNCQDGASVEAFSRALQMASDYCSESKSKLVVTGDFNAPDIVWRDGIGVDARLRYSKDIVDILADNHLSQLVTFPTRNVSTLDLVCCSHPGLVTGLEAIPAFSDHDAITFRLLHRLPLVVPPTAPRFQWARADIPGMAASLRQFSVQYRMAAPSCSVEENWKMMKQTFLKVMSDHIPTFTPKFRANPLPRDVLRLVRKRDRAYRAAKSFPTQENQARYKALSKAAKQECIRIHRDRMTKISVDLPKNPRAFWRHVKNQRNDNCQINSIRHDGGEVTDPEQMANIFNIRFASVFTQECQYDYLPDLPAADIPRMETFSVTVEGVRKRLEGLNIRKASGPDGIPARFLQHMCAEICEPVALLFQQSLTTGSLPLDWKTALVHPIFKKGDRSEPLNYRPVSLTSVLCKQLEHIIVSQSNAFLRENNLLYTRQHGFRAGRSCETALASLTHDWAGVLDSGFISIDSFLLDFAKAFDSVPHRRLMLKVKNIGLNHQVCRWLDSFLCGRKQQVVLSGARSSWLPVSSGVPQGSVAGPMLFSIFINDISLNITPGSTINTFADDCILYRPIMGPGDCRTLQKDLDSLSQWSRKWLLKFNVSKCAHLRISLRAQNDQVISAPIYTLQGENLPRETAAKYLGLTIQSNFKFDGHINRLVNQANSILGLLKRNYFCCTQQAKRLAYIALVRSKLEYGASIFDPYTITATKKLEAVQNRATRFISGNYSRYASVTAMKVRLNLDSLALRRRRLRHKLWEKHCNAAAYIPGIRVLRAAPQIIIDPPVGLLITKNSVIYRTVRELNAQPLLRPLVIVHPVAQRRRFEPP
jgi:hypothetical protein